MQKACCNIEEKAIKTDFQGIASQHSKGSAKEYTDTSYMYFVCIYGTEKIKIF
jgi:hypothetical protein